MIDVIISVILWIWDRITGATPYANIVDEDIATATATTLDEDDPAIARYQKKHRIIHPKQERLCACGCGEVMNVPVGTVQYTIKGHRRKFRVRAYKDGLLQYRFKANIPEVEKASLV